MVTKENFIFPFVMKQEIKHPTAKVPITTLKSVFIYYFGVVKNIYVCEKLLTSSFYRLYRDRQMLIDNFVFFGNIISNKVLITNSC